MQNELQTALFQAFDTLNLQRVKTFSVPPVTLCGPGSVSSCGQQAQTRGLKHLFVMADSFLHQAGMTAGLTRSLAVKGIAMTLWPCPVGEPCITDVCAAVAQLRESGCDGVIAFGGGSVLDAAKAVALLVTNPDSTLAEMSETSVLQPRLPLIAYEDDCVTRLIQDDVNETAYNQIKNWSISELREYVLSDETSVDDIAFTRKGLTSEVVAAVAKICSNADLIYGAKKMPVIKKANTTIGIPGTFSARLQPNDTRDDVQSIAAQIYEGLSFGVGDAVIGVNPVTDDVENLSRVLDTIYGVIDKFNIPTQGCVLAHVTTQIEAIRRGAPGGLIFQSICGSEKGLKEFGVELAMLDEARAVGAEFNRIAGENCLYFETGQGSALSAGANFGADQVTMEARNYGLARHYDPFIVNTVVGFIGPEYLYNDRQIIRAGLEDHFMGKLSGISMGCDCCYTNHADADQNLNENLMILLATAGCNYIMGMPLGDDIMLNYQTTAFHDTATVRQLLNLRPSPEFERWLESMGIMANGRLTKRAGDPSLFF
ncbi:MULTISPECIES: ethanolamine ammonia-lyase subunit EutB [Shigella]|nr:ethanolamine ammonia-lyase, heavy chain [Shigella boydii Sb227]AKI67538.1 ethanolamine ammonia-lyase [Shigella boydii]EFV8765018.1 ethanolamine ammonia lyase large subunit [Shigella flexneri]EFW59917.1 Ethanolamine ammonia-lyase heavy chain [Shigella flexneri CDC 796-83]EGI98027.1 ethanolamine ammonia-lyase heavy chain [Shigella boydii 3594-74]EIB6652128.1 ethanolamine ammonia-lyase subunit EutB [Shigella sonnei]EJH8752617.1 ethanolamine ammonia-lyase subunit EutB [Escherichia coli]ODG882